MQVELALIKMCHIPSVLQLASMPKAATESLTDTDQLKKKTNIIPDAATSVAPAKAYTGAETTGNQNLKEPEPKTQAPQETTPAATASPAIPSISKAAESPIKLKPENGSLSIKLNGNLGTAGTLIPSLTALGDLAAGVDDKEPKYIVGDDKEAFSYEQLLVLWEEYTKKAFDAHKINFYTILKSNPPVLETPTQIKIGIENSAQESILQSEMVEFLNFLRSRLKNFDLSIVTEKVERKIQNRLYTSTEKYQYLVGKNPKLEEMRRRFNLDINP